MAIAVAMRARDALLYYCITVLLYNWTLGLGAVKTVGELVGVSCGGKTIKSSRHG